MIEDMMLLEKKDLILESDDEENEDKSAEE